MPQKRDEKRDLARYIKTVRNYLNEEIQSINHFEKLSSLRGFALDDKIKRVFDFFRKGHCLNFPKVVYRLYEVRSLFWEYYKTTSVVNIFDISYLRLMVYYFIIKNSKVWVENYDT